MTRTLGIHHITSIVGHPQEDLDYNAGIMALRLVKQTLNYDDRDTMHLYYGNETASTGVTTTFPIMDAEDGELGGGQVSRIQYGIKPGQSDYWAERLSRYKIASERSSLMDLHNLKFQDPTGLNIGLIETDLGPDNTWSFAGVEGEQAITGIHAATLLSEEPTETLIVLTDILGYEVVEEDDTYWKLNVHDDFGGILYLEKRRAPRGTMGKGTVHHIAFAIQDEDIDMWHERLKAEGQHPTKIKDRHYFRSIYFREKGGILIELATVGPGFTIDETEDQLGQQFIVPDTFKDDEAQILAEIMPLEVREIEELSSYGYRNREEYEIWKRRNEIRLKINEYSRAKDKRELTPEEREELARLRREFINTK